jgi:radical SAM protein (TIGR01212 family)
VNEPFFSHKAYLEARFGEPVRRLSLDAGFPCPHREGGRGAGGCDFCDARGSGTGAFDSGIGPVEQARRSASRLARSGVRKYIAYFQAFTNTLAPLDRLRSLYRDAAGLDGVVGLTVSTRPDALPDSVLELLASFAPGGSEGTDLDVWVEIGLQSACDATLRAVNRGHDAACFDDAVQRAAGFGLRTAAHVILGLPGEGEATMMRTARHAAALPLEGVKMHHLYVTRDSPLAAAFERGEVRTLSLDEYVPLAVGFLRRLRSDMVVMRLCGSAGRERLLGPVWKAGNGEVAGLIAARMREEGVRQGDLYRQGGEPGP